ncbi:MAG: bifunctional 5,10-methylenetetrahydrofolate dehydrogenase/5,10-methenyltetrahydrofolate cyclohydrolase [Lachnospiraceae bacterium]|nr:bifunctional 5,10-methylenetetrahydrofolate dehydrogenase/5,10-methenyltetrahydrofolate cyclohydrolase [Lachnospiraceae bacterium]
MEELRGMPVVKHIAEDVTHRMEALADKGVVPTLAVIRVGEREDDLSYERGLLKRFDAVAAKVVSIVLEADVTEEKLIETLKKCNEDNSINGILLFRPLPKHLDEKKIVEMVDPIKDVDCMCLTNIAHTFTQSGLGHEPCTPQAVIEMMDFYDIDLTGKKVVVVGRSMVVGKPMAMMLLKKNATVTVCHTKTKDLKAECKEADILVACAGVAEMIDETYVKEGAVVFDVGINVVDGKLCGDVKYKSVTGTADKATPVPGGVGTVTTSVLLKHTVWAAEQMNR